MRNLAEEIRSKALQLGYEDCGIIKVEDMKGYADKLTERIERVPESKAYIEGFYAFAEIEKKYPWAKSVVICVNRYGKYIIPKHLNGLIAKYYLTDSRRDERSSHYQSSIAFEAYLNRCGLQTATNRDFGVTALRWAAYKAGLGAIRNNNFFYTESGSWLNLEVWLINKELELKKQNASKPCPESCNLCVKSCPTKSLSEPFVMNRSTCISCLTTWEGWDLINEKNNINMGKWIFGCDVCQDVCPFNHNKWTESEPFPFLMELGEAISLEKLIEMDYSFLRDVMHPKFWYIKKSDVWRWKINAMNAMKNTWKEEYGRFIDKACNDEISNVREMAQWIKTKTLI